MTNGISRDLNVWLLEDKRGSCVLSRPAQDVMHPPTNDATPPR